MLEPELWQFLGIPQTSDDRLIKRAYAKLLKKTRPEEDPAGFQRLREGYELALRIAAYLRANPEEDISDDAQADDGAESASGTLAAPTAETPDESLHASATLQAAADAQAAAGNVATASRRVNAESSAFAAEQAAEQAAENAAEQTETSSSTELNENDSWRIVDPLLVSGGFPPKQELQTKGETFIVEKRSPSRPSARRLKIRPRPQSALPDLPPEAKVNLEKVEPPSEDELAEQAEQALKATKRQEHAAPEDLLDRAEVELAAAPHEIAGELWQEFVGQSDVLRPEALQRVMSSPVLFNLDVRDAFEFYCAQYCASEQADAVMRKTMVEYFDWPKNYSHLAKMHAGIAHLCLEWYYADAGHAYLDDLRVSGNTSLRMLMANEMPNRTFWHLANLEFTKNMRETIENLEWKFPEVIKHKLNKDVFEEWKALVQKKRYFKQTLGTSVSTGFFIWLFFKIIEQGVNTPLKENPFLLFLILQIFTTAVPALLILHPAQPWLRIRSFTWEYLIDRPLQQYRHHPLMQLGWLVPCMLLPLFNFIIEPAPSLVTTYRFACLLTMLLALFSSSVVFNKFSYFFAALIGFLYMGLFRHIALGPAQNASNLMLGVAFACLHIRSKSELLARVNIDDNRLRHMRLLWLFLVPICLAMTYFERENLGAAFSLVLWVTLLIPGFLLIDPFPSMHAGIDFVVYMIAIQFLNNVYDNFIEPILAPGGKLVEVDIYHTGIVTLLVAQVFFLITNLLMPFLNQQRK